jgi:hypothetical protein
MTCGWVHLLLYIPSAGSTEYIQYRGRVEVRGRVPALSARVYTSTFYVMVDIVTVGWFAPPPSPPWANFSITMENVRQKVTVAILCTLTQLTAVIDSLAVTPIQLQLLSMSWRIAFRHLYFLASRVQRTIRVTPLAFRFSLALFAYNECTFPY